jgi:hypothetical protein
MQIHLSDVTNQARAILGAWQNGDVQRFREELERIQDSPLNTSDPAEAERLELLSAIAGELRRSHRPFGADSSQVYCSLLQHLASSRPGGYSALEAYSSQPCKARAGAAATSSTLNARLLL